MSGYDARLFMPLNWISPHMLMGARLIQSRAVCMIYLLQKIKTATRNNIDNEKEKKTCESIKWWAHITAKTVRCETTKNGLFSCVRLFFRLPSFVHLVGKVFVQMLDVLHLVKWTFQRILHLHHVHLRWFNCSFHHMHSSALCRLHWKVVTT